MGIIGETFTFKGRGCNKENRGDADVIKQNHFKIEALFKRWQ
jgi:hypothetical protein